MRPGRRGDNRIRVGVVVQVLAVPEEVEELTFSFLCSLSSLGHHGLSFAFLSNPPVFVLRAEILLIKQNPECVMILKY